MKRRADHIESLRIEGSAGLAKRRLAVYLCATFGLSWGMWIPAGIMLGTFENGEASAPLMMALVALGMFFPLAGALIANLACGKSNRMDIGLRPNIRGNVRLYLAAWFVPALITLLGCIVFFAVNPQLFDPSLSGFAATMSGMAGSSAASGSGDADSAGQLADQARLIMATSVIAALTIAPFVNAIPAFGEEAGWRGMLFPTLRELMPTWAAVLVSGVIWGLWHAPIIAMGHNYGMGYAGFPWTGIIMMVLACTAMGACLAYLRVRTGSVWSCALAHGAFNAIASTGLYFSLAGQTLAGPSPLGYIAGIPLLLLGILCLAKMRD